MKRALALLLGAVAGCGGSSFGPTSGGLDQGSEAPLEVTRLGVESSPNPSPEDLPESDDPEHRPARPEITPNSFRVADLPVAVIPAPLDAGLAPSTLPPGRGAGKEKDELVTHLRDDGYADLSLRLPERGLGRLTLGEVESNNADGLRVKCGAARKTAVPLRWETLQRDGDGLGRYTVVNAWFDGATCKHSEVERASVTLVPVLGRLLYAYRECRWVCNEGQNITVVGPALRSVSATSLESARQSATAPFAKVTIELQPGGGSSITARIDQTALEAWFGPKRPSWAAGPGEVSVGVDIVQSVEDAEPVAVAYLATPKAPVPRRK